MKTLQHLFDNNRKWAENLRRELPTFFTELSKQQSPEYVWIGCADSRVAANTIVGLMPGEIFVHRNIANQVIHADMNCLSVLQYAIEVLQVKHIIVCGHYGCGGVAAAIDDQRHGLIDNWLRYIQDLAFLYQDELQKIKNEDERLDRLCELNIIQQVINVGDTTIVQEAWENGQELCIHGWIYGLNDGIVKDMNIQIDSLKKLLKFRKEFLVR